MKLILLGAPGCGKGTLASNITKNYNFTHISTGQILREESAKNTPVGIKVKNLIDAGKFVPDDVVLNILKEKLEKIGYDNFILDGFPRNMYQAEQLEKIINIDKAVLIDVDYQTIIDRIVGRRTCIDCGRIFNTSFYNSVECDNCGGILIQRPDDCEEVIKARIEFYKEQTMPVIDYYKDQNKFYNLKVGSTPEETYQKFVNEVMEAK